MAETAEEPVEPTQRKNVCILKASIHCEGCKRKVKKILTQVEGVESVDVDLKQQKVTVTGSADARTLIKKLTKSGKHAQLWPQKDEQIHKTASNKQSTQSHSQTHQVNVHPTSDKQSPKESHPSPELKAPEKNIKAADGVAAESSGGDGGAPAAKFAPDAPTKSTSAGAVEEAKQEDKKSDQGCSAAGEPPHVAPAEKSEKSNGGEGSGTSGKKKKKKGQSENHPTSPENQVSGPQHPTNQMPPQHHHHYPPPHHYYTPPPTQPVYAVSYNTAYPTSSYTASYYAAPPPHSHADMHLGSQTQPPPSDLQLNPRQPLDSFEIFSDENPNGCSIM